MNRGTLSDRLNPKHPFFDAQLKAAWKSMPKKERARMVEEDRNLLKKARDKINAIVHPFEADTDDHAESPPEAYAHVAKLLDLLAGRLGKTRAELSIYDPYYCAGAVIGHLSKQGFSKVYNRCEDCYSMWSKCNVPKHDVLVTNPPYSADHVHKLLSFAKRNNKPFLLLMPNYVVAKPFFSAYESSLAFLYPVKRYNYWTPHAWRPKTKLQNHCCALGVRTSPFASFWYVNLAPRISKKELLQWWTCGDAYTAKSSSAGKQQKETVKTTGKAGCFLCGGVEQLPYNYRPSELKQQQWQDTHRGKLNDPSSKDEQKEEELEEDEPEEESRYAAANLAALQKFDVALLKKRKLR